MYIEWLHASLICEWHSSVAPHKSVFIPDHSCAVTLTMVVSTMSFWEFIESLPDIIQHIVALVEEIHQATVKDSAYLADISSASSVPTVAKSSKTQ